MLSLVSEQKRNVISALIHLNLSNKGKPFSAGFFLYDKGNKFVGEVNWGHKPYSSVSR